MPTQDLDRPVHDNFKIKPLPPAPAPGGGRTPGSGGLIGVLVLLAVTAGGFFMWRFFLHPPIAPPEVASSSTSTSMRAPDQPLLRIHGSNTIGETLMPELVEAFMASESYTHLERQPGDKPTVTYVAGQGRGGTVRVEIAAPGSETGFPDLAAGRADIAMSSDTINPDQVQDLKKLGDVTRAGEHVIGIDGVTVIVHRLNPVSELSLRQVADIFSGAIKDWSQVGGARGAIKLYARDDNSGTWTIFRNGVLQPFDESLSSAAQRFSSSGGLSDAVAAEPQGIGFIGLAYASNNKALGLSEPSVEARRPAPCTLKTEEYVLTRRLYLYTTATHPLPEVTHFIRFATSRKAWPIVQNAGFVNLDPSPVAACDSSAQNKHTAEYVKATTHARRLLTNFHFRPHSLDELDSKAHLSMAYLSAYLASGASRGSKKLLLIGYNDEGLSAQDNQQRSLRDANVLRDQLAKRLRQDGINVQFDPPKGLGAQELLAPPDSPAGREKNRRVEVWLH